MTQIVSPCKNTCGLNKENICIGCGRLVDEITGWDRATDAEKLKIIENSTRRLAGIQAKMPWNQTA